MSRMPELKAGRARGFSLIEVLITLIVVSIGLLGLAKMESLALVSTNVAGTRAVAAIQASSLAAAMHANRGYWGGGTAPASMTVGINGAGTAVIVGSGLPSGSKACTTSGSGACSVDEMAAYDLQNWAVAVGQVLPAYSATIACNITLFPVNCTISIAWAENAVAAMGQQTNMSSLAQPVYTLYVEP